MSADTPVSDGDGRQSSGLTTRRASIRTWFRDLFGGQSPAPPRIDNPVQRPFNVPAMNGGFDFTVVVTVAWTAASGVKWSELDHDVQYHQGAVWAAIEHEVRQVGRCWAPNQAVKVEEQLLDRLDCLAREWRFVGPRSDGLRWRVRSYVDPAEPVKAQQQQFWLRRLEQEALVRYSKDTVAAMRDLVARWRGLLGDLQVDDPSRDPAPYLAPFLVQLAVKPKTADETVLDLSEYRLREAVRLRRVVQDAVVANQRLNTFEFLTSYESALKVLLEHVGALPAVPGQPLKGGNGKPQSLESEEAGDGPAGA
jgi:hypothetical protein